MFAVGDIKVKLVSKGEGKLSHVSETFSMLNFFGTAENGLKPFVIENVGALHMSRQIQKIHWDKLQHQEHFLCL